MKITTGRVLIERGDCLVDVSIVGVQVVLDVEQERIDIRGLDAAFESMGCATNKTVIQDCYITTSGAIAAKVARAELAKISSYREEPGEQPSKRRSFWQRLFGGAA